MLPKLSKATFYRHLEAMHDDLMAPYRQQLTFAAYDPATLPPFTDRLAVIPEFLPPSTLQVLCDAACTPSKSERSYIPGHKKGGTISYADLHTTAPALIAFYHAPQLHQFCSALIGEPIMPTPIHDQVSCTLLFYDKPGDHIGWHYDYNFYNGRHFTALLSLVNQHHTAPRLSSAKLMARKHQQEIVIPTPPNTFVLFEGAYVYHQVSKLERHESRIVLSMTFCTNPTTSALKNTLRRFKDTAYFGLRALWT